MCSYLLSTRAGDFEITTAFEASEAGSNEQQRRFVKHGTWQGSAQAAGSCWEAGCSAPACLAPAQLLKVSSVLTT